MATHDWNNLTLGAVLKDEDLAWLFREFLHQMQSAENLSFWLEAERWKDIFERDQREARRAAEEIVVKYLGDSENGPASYGEVNLDESMKTQIIDAVCSSKPLSQDLFVESQGWIFSLMADDCYRKFLQCPKFKQYKANGGRLDQSDAEKRENHKEKEKKAPGFKLFLLKRSKKKDSASPSPSPTPSPTPSPRPPNLRNMNPDVARTPSMMMLSDYITSQKQEKPFH